MRLHPVRGRVSGPDGSVPRTGPNRRSRPGKSPGSRLVHRYPSRQGWADRAGLDDDGVFRPRQRRPNLGPLATRKGVSIQPSVTPAVGGLSGDHIPHPSGACTRWSGSTPVSSRRPGKHFDQPSAIASQGDGYGPQCRHGGLRTVGSAVRRACPYPERLSSRCPPVIAAILPSRGSDLACPARLQTVQRSQIMLLPGLPPHHP